MRNGKGLTPVVAIVLLLLLGITITGATYTFVQTVISGSEEETLGTLQTQVSMERLLCSQGLVEITVQNTGDASIQRDTVDLFLYNYKENLVTERTGIPIQDLDFTRPGELDTFTAFLTDPVNATERYEVELAFGKRETVKGQCFVNTSYTNAATVYAADEGTGTWLNDSTINHNNAQLFDGAGWTTTGKHGNATRFDGNPGVINASSSDSLNLSQGFTVSLWVNTTNLAGERVLLRKAGAYAVNMTQDENVTFAVNDGGWTTITGGHLPTDTWTHVTATYNTSHGAIYVDGEQQKIEPFPSQFDQSTNPLAIGATNTENGVFNGELDEIQVYDQDTR